MTQSTRQCTRCKEHLALDRFVRDASRADGLSKWCRACVADNGRKHYERNRAAILERQRLLRLEDPEGHRERQKKSYEKNRDKRIAYNKKRYVEQREEILAASKARHRKVRYGLDAEQFDAMLAAQGGGCAICGVQDGRWHVDHDHACCPTTLTCGKCVRGILCHPCNVGIGGLGDDAERCRRAAAYLERSR